MGRIVPAALVALLLVGGGLWFGARNQAGAQEQSEATLPPERDVPAGYTLVEPLSEERRTSFEEADDVLEAGRDYHALLETSKGDMLIDLYEEQTPVTVNNFVFLALNRYYDGVPFHRVLEDFMAQTGDPTGTGTGGPGYTFEDEIVPELTHDSRGVVSMANAGPGTNGSQFFITFNATQWLDGAHTVFGRVVSGEEVLDDLQRVDPGTPSAVLRLDGTLGELAEQGVDLAGEADVRLQDYLEERLGAVPAVGQTFQLDGRVGVLGRVQGVPAAGFFPVPDVIEQVTILVAADGDTPDGGAATGAAAADETAGADDQGAAGEPGEDETDETEEEQQ